MTSIVGRVFTSLRVFLGLNDPSENRLHQAHGWLLPPTAGQERAAQAKAGEGREGMFGARRP